MDKGVGFLVILFVVAASGQDYVLTIKQYAEQQDTPPGDVVARLISQFATGIQEIQRLSKAVEAPDVLCLGCQQYLAMLHDMATDRELMQLMQNFTSQYGCEYIVPPIFKARCDTYADHLPDMVVAFADIWLNPNQCAPVCPSAQVSQPINVFSSIVKKMGGA